MSTQAPQLTPAMRQYREFKEQYPGYVLFFRMGDFYELFDDDAQTAVRVLGVTVHNIGRPGDKAIPLPGETFRVGMPVQTIEGCLRRMIAAGHKVAICEQVGDAAAPKGIVQREIIRTMTPDESGANNDERDRCDMASATATKSKKANGTKSPARAAKKPAAQEPKLPTGGEGQPISLTLTAEERKVLPDVLDRFKGLIDRGVMTIVSGKEVASAAVAKLIAAVK